MTTSRFTLHAEMVCPGCFVEFTRDIPSEMEFYDGSDNSLDCLFDWDNTCPLCGADQLDDSNPPEWAAPGTNDAESGDAPPRTPRMEQAVATFIADDDSRPFAVYGTLRTGAHNARMWAGAAWSGGNDMIAGYRLLSNGGFPYATPADDDSTTVVELVYPDTDTYERIVEAFDHLEGVPLHYTRELVETVSGEDCWLYVAAPGVIDQRRDPLAPVPHNDWANVDPKVTTSLDKAAT